MGQVAPEGHGVKRRATGVYAGSHMAIVECLCGRLMRGDGDSELDAATEASMAFEAHLSVAREVEIEAMDTWLQKQLDEARKFGLKPSGGSVPWVHPRETRPR